MAYIGREPTNTGEFLLIDDISGDFNGSTTSFTLKVGRTEVTPAAANTIIALDGVLQNPSSSYSISGSTVTFTGAPDSGLDFYGVLSGQSQYISNNSITDDHISETANISGSKINTNFAGQNIVATHITASGNISASGIVIADTFQSTGGSVDGISFTDDLNITGNITASGDISGSGNIFGTGNLDIDGTSNLASDLFVGGNITGSAVSASVGKFTTVDIDGGTIDGITTFTAGGDLDIGAHDFRAATITADGLTATRVPFAGTDGVLSDDSDLTFATDTLTATKIGAFTAAGAIDFDSQNMTNVDIDSGVITGITDLVVADGGTGVSTLTDGGVLLGSGTSAITAMAVLADSEMIVGDGTTDPVAESGATLRTSIGVGTTDDVQFTNITGSEVSSSTALFTTATIDKIGGAIDFNNENMTNVDIDSGTITGITDITVADGGTGASTAAGAAENLGLGITDDVKFANITGSNDISASGNLSITGNVDVDGTSNFAGDVTLQNDLVVTGRLTAEEIHTTFISSSIAQATGSNIFGDATTDSHHFTGSVDISGSLRVSDGNVVVSDTLTATNIGAFTSTGAIDFDSQNMTNVDIDSGTITGITDITVADGGTGVSTLTDGGVLLGSGTSAITAMSVLTDGQMIVGDGTTDPVAESGATLRTSIGVGTGDDVVFTSLETSGNISGSSTSTGSFGSVIGVGNSNSFGTTLIKGSGQKLHFSDVGGEYISGDGTDLTITSGNDIVLALGAAGSVYHTGDGGSVNTIYGYQAGIALASGGNNNVLLGNIAGTGLTTGGDNVVIGYQAMRRATTAADENIAIGRDSMGGAWGAADVNGCVAIGYDTLSGTLTSDASGTIAIGIQSGKAITSGIANTVIGYQAANDLTTGGYNTVLGYQALDRATTAALRNVAIGHQAMHGNFTTAAVVDCVAIGVNALEATLTADASGTIAIGKGALAALTSGIKNIAIGYQAQQAQTTGHRNTVIGYAAMQAADGGEDFNTVIGSEAGYGINNDASHDNVIIGKNALQGGTGTILGNVAVGTGAMEGVANNSQTGTVAIGASALGALTSGAKNTAVGYQAGTAMTDGTDCTILGYQAGLAMTGANNNVAIGTDALQSMVHGDNNTAVGLGALKQADEAGINRNTAVGHTAATNLSNGASNTAIGSRAMGTGVVTGDNNTAVGESAGVAITSGANNTLIGASTGQSLTSGTSNTAIGINAMANFTVTGNSNTTVGNAAGYSITSGGNNLFLGNDSGRSGSPGGNITTASNEIALGDENISEANIQVDWTVASDQRDKTDFTALDLGLDFVKGLAPVTYKWDKRSKYGDKMADDYDLNAQTPDGTHKEDWLDIGFKAQEVEALEKSAGYKIADKTNLTTSITGDGKQYGIQYSKFVPILVKAIQELSSQVTELKKEIEELKN